MENMDNNTFNSTPLSPVKTPPEASLADHVQLIILLVLLLIGAPINLVSLTKLRSAHSLTRINRLALLRLHLNISDLMVLFIFVTSSVCWQLTYQWRGGAVLCKVVKFLNSTSFQLSSNIVVCVALDRLFTILAGTMCYKKYVNRHPARYVRMCVIISWIVAIGVNILQFFVWVVISPFPHTAPQWKQCTTVWTAMAHYSKMAKLDPTLNKDLYTNAYKASFPITHLTYNAIHIVAVFWIPAAVIVFSYTIVVFNMYRLSAKKRTSTKRMGNVGFLSSDTVTQVSTVPVCVEMIGGGNTANGDQTNGARTNDQQEDSTLPRDNSKSDSVTSKALLLPVAIHRMRSKTFRTSLILILAYFVCWAPYNVLALWQFFDEAGYRRYAVGMRYLNALIVFNSVVNPFLYGTLKFKLPWRKRDP